MHQVSGHSKALVRYIATKDIQDKCKHTGKMLNIIYHSRNANWIKISTDFVGEVCFFNSQQPIVLTRFLSTWCKLEYLKRGTSIKIMPSTRCLWQLHREFLWLMFNIEGPRPQGKTYHPWAGRLELYETAR